MSGVCVQVQNVDEWEQGREAYGWGWQCGGVPARETTGAHKSIIIFSPCSRTGKKKVKKNSRTTEVKLNYSWNSKTQDVTERHVKEKQKERKSERRREGVADTEEKMKCWCDLGGWGCWRAGRWAVCKVSHSLREEKEEIKYTWKVSSLFPENFHTCAGESPRNETEYLPARGGLESRDAACLWQCCA